jgi:hypothetical protein
VEMPFTNFSFKIWFYVPGDNNTIRHSCACLPVGKSHTSTVE